MKWHITPSLQISEISNVNGGTFVCTSDFTGRNSAKISGYDFNTIIDG